MTIPQIDGVDTNTVNYVNEPTFICLALMTVITVIWVSLFIIAKLPQADNEINLITYLVDNHGKTINQVVLIIVLILWALAAYFNHFA